MDIPIKRIRQIKESIDQRESFDSYEQNKVFEWMTKTVSMFVAQSGFDMDGERTKELSKAAAEISLFDKPKAPKKKKTYRTLDGKTISASELRNYRYDEIDHTQEDYENIQRALEKNRNKDISTIGGMFTM